MKKTLIKEELTCKNGEQCRITLFNDLVNNSNPKTKKPYYTKDWNSFLKEYFGSETTLKNFHTWGINNGVFLTSTFEEIVKNFACDLVNASGDQTTWGKAIDICKPAPKPEPVKKPTKKEILAKYVEKKISPFTGGVSGTTGDYYEKTKYDYEGYRLLFRYYTPDDSGKVLLQVVDPETDDVIRQEYKKTSVLPSEIFESLNKRNRILESKNRDLRVISLLKEIRKIHITDKIVSKLIKEQTSDEDEEEEPTDPTAPAPTPKKKNPAQGLSPQQIEQKTQMYSKYFKTSPQENADFQSWANTVYLSDIVSQVKSLIDEGYRGVMFKYLFEAIKFLSMSVPGKSGLEGSDEAKTDQYDEIMGIYNEIQTDEGGKALKNPTQDEIDQYGFYNDLPPNLAGFFKYSVFRPKQLNKLGARTEYANNQPNTGITYENKVIDKKTCQDDLEQYYYSATTDFRAAPNYCQTREFPQRKAYLIGCNTQNKFSKLLSQRYHNMFLQLQRGLLVNKRGETKNIKQGCALKD